MATATVDSLTRLHALILEERECAKRLDVSGLARTAEAKAELVAALGSLTAAPGELQDLLRTIRQENRRNAYLFWSGLSLVRETMGFFNQQAAMPGYGPGGGSMRAGGGGRLLSGKV